MRFYAINVRSRVAALLLIMGAILAGVAILTVGLVLLAILVAAGVLLGLGAAIYYRLRRRRGTLDARASRRVAGLDPAQEIFVQQPPRLRDKEGRSEP